MRLIVEVQASTGQVQTFDAPEFDMWIRCNEASFIYVMVCDKEGREKALAIFYRPVYAKFVEKA